jgi:hypothetical protein
MKLNLLLNYGWMSKDKFCLKESWWSYPNDGDGDGVKRYGENMSEISDK